MKGMHCCEVLIIIRITWRIWMKFRFLSITPLRTCSQIWISFIWRLSCWIREIRKFSGIDTKSSELNIFPDCLDISCVQKFWSSMKESFSKLVWYIRLKFCSIQLALCVIKKDCKIETNSSRLYSLATVKVLMISEVSYSTEESFPP